MRKLQTRLATFVSLIIGVFVIAPALAGPASVATEPLRVFVSVLPLQTFVEEVGGEHVEVAAMVRPGYNPHTYEPTPHQISALAEVVLYVRTGVPFEHAWMDRLRSVNPTMQVLDARSGIDLRRTEVDANGNAGRQDEHHNNDRHQHGRTHDPHVWTNPLLSKQMARNIRDKLTELDPRHREDYARNFKDFAADLDALDRDIRALLEGLPNRKLMVFHPAWGYFADAYGLIQVPIEVEGKEPGAKTLSALIEQARLVGTKVIFVQPQYNQRSAARVADAIGGRVAAIDPLSANYAENLRSVAREIAEAARQ